MGSIVSTDLVWYGALDVDETDGTTVGGGIDTTTIIVPASSSLFNAMSDSKVDIVSSNSGDTSQTLTITGRSDAGSLISETLNLNGTTTVNGALTYNRIEKFVMSATATGTITITAHTGSTTIGTLPPGVKTLRRLFYNVSADVSGGSQRIYYTKAFVKNTNGTNALLGAQISKQADPSNVITFWVTGSVNDTGTSTNRQTAPAGSTFSSSAQNTATTDLASGAAQGVWFAMTLAAGTAAATSTFTPQIAGSTT